MSTVLPGDDFAKYIERVKAMKRLIHRWKEYTKTNDFHAVFFAMCEADPKMFDVLGALIRDTEELWNRVKGTGDPE